MEIFFLSFIANVDEDANDDGSFETGAVEEKDEDDDEKTEKADNITEKVLHNSMVESYEYDKKHHLWAKLTFNVSLKHEFEQIQLLRS